jgi:hypothetical protein
VQPTVRVEGEVLPPPLAPRVKEGDNEASFGIDGGEVRSLLLVAPDAAQTEVVDVIGPLVLLSDDMIDLMREDRRFLREPAIFTGPAGASLDETPAPPGRPSRGRAHRPEIFCLEPEEAEALVQPDDLGIFPLLLGRE